MTLIVTARPGKLNAMDSGGPLPAVDGFSRCAAGARIYFAPPFRKPQHLMDSRLNLGFTLFYSSSCFQTPFRGPTALTRSNGSKISLNEL